ncbi:MAG: hypothetical protein ACE145_08540 [Terriglobia bacterium]
MRKVARLKGAAVLACAAATLWISPLQGQQVPAENPDPGENAQKAQSAPAKGSPPHRFWDSTNAALFAGVAGARALDYASTRDMRSRGVNEALLSNSIVDNRPLFVGIEAAGTALSIGVSYLFHRTGHHKLERWVSIVHIGVGVGGSIRNYKLEPTTAPPR